MRRAIGAANRAPHYRNQSPTGKRVRGLGPRTFSAKRRPSKRLRSKTEDVLNLVPDRPDEGDREREQDDQRECEPQIRT